MTLALVVLIGPPVIVYLSLCRLDRGRPAAIGTGVSVIALAAVWPLVLDGDPLMRIIAELMLGAAVAAALAQGIRMALPQGPLAYPGLVVLILVAGLFALFQYIASAGA